MIQTVIAMRRLQGTVFFTAALFLLLVTNLFPQSISGFVYDGENGEALIGCNVFLKGTVYGSSTNQSGYFVIPKVPTGGYDLICAYLGYETAIVRVTVKSDGDVRENITLTQTPLLLKTVVVVGDSLSAGDRLYEKPVSKLELTHAQIKYIPQVAEADLLRSLQTLPGIVS